MSFIIYPQKNNQLVVVSPTGELTLDEVIVRVVPFGKPYKIVESLDIDGEFFNAHEFDEEVGAVINIDKAKEIQKDKWRAARKPLLEKLDIDFMKAVETGNTELIQSIRQQKQSLRDVTNTTLPDTLEGIKSTWPEILNG